MSNQDTKESLVETLRGVHVLHDISDEHLEQIAVFTQCWSIPANTVIFHEGEEAECIYLVDRGNVVLEVQVPGGGNKRICTIGAGELLGWSPVLGETRMTATARTIDETRACGIDAKQVLAFCEHNPRFGYEFMRRTALAVIKRLTATRLQLLDVYRHDLPTSHGEGE